MKTIRSFRDLEEFGIIALTGESCSYSLRMLCDLTDEGVVNLSGYLGIKPQASAFGEAWNGNAASVMLSRDMINPLAEYLFLNSGCLFIIKIDGVPHGVEQRDLDIRNKNVQEFVEYIKQMYASCDVRTHSPVLAGPSVGGRNVHAFSGRTV